MTAALDKFRERRRREQEKRIDIPADIVAGFREDGCPNCLGDVLHGLGLRSVVHGLLPLSPDMTLCGPAVTMRLIASRSAATFKEDEFLAVDLIETAKAGDVLVFDAGGRMDAGPWGSNTSAIAKGRRLAGTVIDGVCRDTGATVEMGYPVFSRGRAIRTGHGVFYSTCVIGEPVQLGTRTADPVMVAPGDLIMGNVDGLCVVPVERAAEVLALYRERHTIDVEKHAKFVAGGGTYAEINAPYAERTRALEGLH